MKHLIISLLACLAVVSCKTAEESLTEAGNKPISAFEIRQLLAGNTLKGISSRGFDFTVVYNAKGAAKITSNKYNETGKWWTEGTNKYCTQWPTVRDGAKGCRRIYKIGNEYQMVRTDGSKSSRFTIVKGS